MFEMMHDKMNAMITDTDVTKLKKVFATKEDLNDVRKEFTSSMGKFATKEDFADLRLEVGELKDRFDIMQNTLDKIVGAIHDLAMEMRAGYSILERKIYHVAEKTGVIIPD
jgi:hypothetical protein